VNDAYVAAAAVALSAFLIASFQDLRTREVSDLLWIFSGLVGIALSVIMLLGSGAFPAVLSILFPAFLFADMFVDWESLLGRQGRVLRYLAGALCGIGTLYAVYSMSSSPYVDTAASESLWILFILLLFYIDVIRGGADAKALVCLVLLFPIYPVPVVGRIPPSFESFTFPFFLNVLLLAAVLSLLVPLYLFLLNASRGDVSFPGMFIGFRKEVASINTGREWLMESPDDAGRPVRLRKLGRPGEEERLDTIRSLGWKKVWVSPKIPFIVFLTAGLILTLLTGSIIAYL
jgi:preflagellin peptidase FlaK